MPAFYITLTIFSAENVLTLANQNVKLVTFP
jgi:hypothetical protein